MCFCATHCPLPHHGWTRHLALFRAFPASAAARHLRDLFLFPPLSSLGNLSPFWHAAHSDITESGGCSPSRVEVLLPSRDLLSVFCWQAEHWPSLCPAPTVLCLCWVGSELFPFRGGQKFGKFGVHAPSEVHVEQWVPVPGNEPWGAPAMQIPGQQCGQGRTSPPGTGFILLGRGHFAIQVHSLVILYLTLGLSSNAVFCLSGEFLCFRKPWAFDGKPGCSGWLPIQALDL